MNARISFQRPSVVPVASHIIYGFFEAVVYIEPGQTNVIPFTIWIPKLDPSERRKNSLTNTDRDHPHGLVQSINQCTATGPACHFCATALDRNERYWTSSYRGRSGK